MELKKTNFTLKLELKFEKTSNSPTPVQRKLKMGSTNLNKKTKPKRC
jgi:hypothetical protein